MYVKIENIVGVHADGYILECRTLSWERVENEKAALNLEEMAGVGDYAIYNSPKDIKLALVLDDTMILLERGDVYVMNDSGKTVDSIHV